MQDSCLPDDLLHRIARQDELLVIKNAQIWNMMYNNALTVGERRLYDYWESTLSFAWNRDEWHDNLKTITEIIAENFSILSDFREAGFRDYLELHRVETLGISTQNAVKHTFHGGKYEHTIRQSWDQQSLRLPTAGDAILRLITTVVVDAIDAVWKRQGTPVSIFGRDGPLCEAKAATRAVKNRHLAVLFDKLGLCLW